MHFLGTRGDEAGEAYSSQATQGQRPSGAQEDDAEPPHDNDIPF
jgi:hypothetical protein